MVVMTMLILVCLAGTSTAQEEYFSVDLTSEGLRQASESTELVVADPTVSDQINCELDLFVEADGEYRDSQEQPVMGISTSLEVSSTQKSGIVTPYYHFKERFVAKALIPLIYKRTLHYHDGDAEASGIGDVALNVRYDWPLEDDSRKWLLDLQAKFPTGDSEKMDGEHLVPLGTGSLDFILSSAYSRAFSNWSFLGKAFVRKNTINSKTVELMDGAGALVTTSEYDITAGNQLGLACHFRRQLNEKWDGYLGANLLVVGDGETEYTTSYADGTPDLAGSYANNQGMKLMNLLPGVSYNLGLIKPYLGLRIPLFSSYNSEVEPDSRDLTVVIQFTYKPGR
jgi:hypothetical protein